MKRIRYLLAAVCLLASLTGCAGEPSVPFSGATVPEKKEISVPPESTEASQLDPVQELLDSMTLEEKAAQLFIVTPEALDLPQIKAPMEKIPQDSLGAVENGLHQALKAYPVGGIIFFAGNLYSPDQITAYNAMLQRSSRIPLLLAVDEEGGTVARLGNHRAFNVSKFPDAETVGESQNPVDAFQMGSAIGSYLQEYGFNLDFAPVADVNTNPDNPVIGRRAFSSNPETAAAMAGAMARGLQEAGIIPTFKHFPGHGDTAQDSHSGIALVDKSHGELAACEWIPFRQAGPETCVMVGHIALPQITGDSTPATMSKTIVTDILRQELGFQGVIVTDSLLMGAVTDSYTSAEAAVCALNAGCDLLLTPKNFEEAYNGILEAVKNGEVSMERLNESVRRILTMKAGLPG